MRAITHFVPSRKLYNTISVYTVIQPPNAASDRALMNLTKRTDCQPDASPGSEPTVQRPLRVETDKVYLVQLSRQSDTLNRRQITSAHTMRVPTYHLHASWYTLSCATGGIS